MMISLQGGRSDPTAITSHLSDGITNTSMRVLTKPRSQAPFQDDIGVQSPDINFVLQVRHFSSGNYLRLVRSEMLATIHEGVHHR